MEDSKNKNERNDPDEMNNKGKLSEKTRQSQSPRKYEGHLLIDSVPLCKSRCVPWVFTDIQELNIDLLNIGPFVTHNLNDLDNLEAWRGVNFSLAISFVERALWDRVEIVKKFIPNMPFQMVLIEPNRSRLYPHKFVYRFCKLAIKCGMGIFRVFDSRNYLPNLILGIKAASKVGGIVETGISYMADVYDPSQTKYDINYYVNLADELVEAGAYVLVIKDMAGLLTHSAATLLVRALRKRHPGITISIHKEDSTGASVTAMLSCASVNDVAIDSMTGITSQLNMKALVVSFPNSGRSLDLDLDGFWSVYSAYWQQSSKFISTFTKFKLRAERVKLNIMIYMDDAVRVLDYTEVTKSLLSKKRKIEAAKSDKQNNLWDTYIKEDGDWRDLLEIILEANDYPKDFSTSNAIASNIDDIHKFLSKLIKANVDEWNNL